MTGLRTSSGIYYVCGSQPYRRGKGCGPGVYVPKERAEAEVITGLEELLAGCSNPAGFVRKVNAEIRKIWEKMTGFDPDREKKLEAIDMKIANIRTAIEDGIEDAMWANTRLKKLTAERQRLGTSPELPDRPPTIDPEEALNYRKKLGKIFAHGKPSEIKKVLRTMVQKIKLAPEERVVEITYRLPEPVMNNMVAGAGFEPATFGL